MEEKLEIIEKMRQIDRQRDKSVQTDGSPASLFNFFVTVSKSLLLWKFYDYCMPGSNQVIREQLHIILCMSPIGDAFRNRVRKFPSIVNCCTIDWFQPWPPDALLAVATRYTHNIQSKSLFEHRFTKLFRRFFAEEDLTTLEKSVAIDMCMEFHTTTQTLSDDFYLRLKRQNYVTPTSYLELIFTFKDLLRAKRT